MCDELYGQFQIGARVVLYRIGKGYAKKLSAAITKLGNTKESAIEGLVRIAKSAGYGEIHYRTRDESSSECVANRSPFVFRRKDVSGTSCHFLSGVLASIAADIYNEKFDAQEVEGEAN